MSKSSWVGKIGGAFFGLLITGNPIGMAFGLFFGHQFDRVLNSGASSQPNIRFSGGFTSKRKKIFFESLFLSMGHLAKVDGRVSEEEIQVAQTIMQQWNLTPEDKKRAIELFTRGKSPSFPIYSQIKQLRVVCQEEPELLRTFMAILIEMPLAKGNLDSVERDLIWRIARDLGFGRIEIARLEARLIGRKGFSQESKNISRESIIQAYKVLGLKETSSDSEIKTAYRRLINRNHPDKLVAKGLPDAMMDVAKERTREIRTAYELLRDQRNIR
ncbi:MAG: co-chaperone DjlA [Pseudomonadota bacterium]|nr:co-chaperone DjlA [Pseudomonadota bacterium]